MHTRTPLHVLRLADGDNLQVFNLDTKVKLKAHHMPESVEYWKWINPNMLGLVTAGAVYHWSIEVCVCVCVCKTLYMLPRL